ncbi:hypothetical protein OSH11_23145 [Kaistia dalseonensis]|uniref:Chromosomal replication initiation ATPase DnaA n=1 Tax=Kaistia dalseonensis TaxID=410840 RepID=A0ABU0HD56_9HYPH|nr:helix-turn-helix domain-containing protein [Kaistia dalseonensis]MCX5497613.1 hypothetical protein [Kaistia dalseonensis]MDQ0440255.1 chromosomal replication initiation ATPase DnaA [Kaistia dalseonensis]
MRRVKNERGRARPRRVIPDEARHLIAAVVGPALEVEAGELLASGRGSARGAYARQIAIYLACTRFGLSFTEAGQLFGRDRTTAAHACRRVEERRDERSTDQMIDRLDRAVAQEGALMPAFRRLA